MQDVRHFRAPDVAPAPAPSQTAAEAAQLVSEESVRRKKRAGALRTRIAGMYEPTTTPQTTQKELLGG